jgi:AraC family transcriptional regulator
VLEGNEALDTLFRQQLMDLLATRLLAAHTGSPSTIAPARGGLAPKTLLRAIERLRSDSDADVSLAALAAEAGLSRFHFVGLSRTVPGFLRMPGCDSTGSSKP